MAPFALLLTLLPVPSTPGAPRQLAVAAAADLRFALDDLVAGFEAEHPGVRVSPTFGSSGNFFAQLQSEAPFDLFLSADIDYPNKLAEAGLARDGKVFSFAEGAIVLWAPNANAGLVHGLESLVEPAVKRIAIANPAHAPYGRAAEAALRSAGVYEAVKPKLVLGENIVQTAQFAESGNADVAIIALSLALAPGLQKEGRFLTIPQGAYPKIIQGGIILKWAREPDAAAAFRDYMASASGREILKRFGFRTPGE
jgi:molybdate transport system substrate-binding protein